MTAPRPLDGMLVLDLTMMIAGPLAGTICADLGADVIKVEPPSGDGSRAYFSADPTVRFNSMTAAFNRGKRSLAIDLTDPDDHALFLRIAAEADVVIEAFRPGVAAKLGITYDEIRAVNDDIVYVSISGFGQHGPDAGRPGFDTAIQGESGLMVITGEPDGLPQRVGTQIVDASTGITAAQAICAALLNRERHGCGDRIECSLLATAIALQTHNYTEYLTVDVPLTRAGAHPVFTTPSGTYATSDGLILFSANTPKHWSALTRALGDPELIDNPKHADQAGRSGDRAFLLERVQQILRTRTTAEWVERFRAAGIVYGEVRDYPAVVASPQFAAEQLALEVERDGVVTHTVRTPARYSSFTPAPTAGAPALGADTAAIRAEYPA
ncbi:CaiB/BaiF CoA transferase family protein [Cumulibacter manganitolerans]|uniref:CaiB/BaiF CoA transferase family protein n=1 Tax=Cumulibacter manganitolerans TaxID=1884992 RepID=UPI001297441C|nr:CoA transferase [Cumulibacter manganitolerans]